MQWARLAMLSIISMVGCNNPASIEVEPQNLLLKSKEDTVQLKATVKDSSGEVLNNQKVTFKSMTPTIANVDALGNVSAVVSGAATILVAVGDVNKEIQVLIQIPKKIAIDPESPMLMLGVTRGFKATVINDREQPMIAGEVTWSSSDPAIFTVDKQGNVKTLQEGEATLTAFAAGIKDSTKITVKHEELHEDGSLSQ